MTKTAFIKQTVSLGLAYSVCGSVHCHGGKHGSVQADSSPGVAESSPSLSKGSQKETVFSRQQEEGLWNSILSRA